MKAAWPIRKLPVGPKHILPKLCVNVAHTWLYAGWRSAIIDRCENQFFIIYIFIIYIIQICSGITRGRVLNGELYMFVFSPKWGMCWLRTKNNQG